MSKEDSNLNIIKRLLELGRNQMDGYTLFPRPYKEEQIWLANILSDSLRRKEADFAEVFRTAVGHYKSSLKEGKGYGWFHGAEKLVWAKMQINQLMYAIYGDERFTATMQDLRFNEELGKDAYRDLICQIDRTVLMTPEELERHNEECNRMAMEILDEIKKEEEEKK